LENFDEVVKRVMDFLDEAGKSRDEGNLELDEVVHDLMNAKASSINNEGLESQVKFILTEMGPEGERAIKDAIGSESVYDQWVTKCPACGQKCPVRRVPFAAYYVCDKCNALFDI